MHWRFCYGVGSAERANRNFSLLIVIGICGFLAVPSWKGGLRKIEPTSNTRGDVRTITGPWKGWRGLKDRLVAISSTWALEDRGNA